MKARSFRALLVVTSLIYSLGTTALPITAADISPDTADSGISVDADDNSSIIFNGVLIVSFVCRDSINYRSLSGVSIVYIIYRSSNISGQRCPVFLCIDILSYSIQ